MFPPLTANGFYLRREGANHTIYTNGPKTLPVKRHKTLDRLTGIGKNTLRAILVEASWQLIAKDQLMREKYDRIKIRSRGKRAGRAFALNEEPPLRANQELLATGLANVGGALIGSMPAGGGTTQTAVNRLAGAHTQLAELVTAGAALMTMLLLAPLIGLMPEATLAALVIVYSIGLIEPTEFRDILEVRRMEFIWAIAAFAGVVVLGTLKGILVAIVVSLVAIAYQMANPPVYVLGRKPGSNVFRPRSDQHPEDETFPGLLLIRVEGRIFFGNAERIADRIRPLLADAKPGVVVLDLSRVPDLEYTALKMLTEAEKRQRQRGVTVWLAGLNPEVLATVRRSSLGEALGREKMFFNLELAVTKYLEPSGAKNEM